MMERFWNVYLLLIIAAIPEVIFQRVFAADSVNVSTNVDGCLCNYESSIKSLTCSNISFYLPTLNDPRRWCFDGKLSHIQSEHLTFSDVNQLRITRSQLDVNFSFNFLENFVNLSRLVLNLNNFTQGELILYQPIPSFMSRLEELDLSSNNLNSIQRHVFTAMPLLMTIHISENNMSALPENCFSDNLKLKRLFMRDNPWWCNELEWLLDWLEANPRVLVNERRHINCTYHERNSNYGSTTFENLLDECPKNCVCRMVRSMVKVNCSSRGFTTFPPLVPAYTGVLHMENNRIDNFHSLINGTNYLNLRFLYLENNSIDSISILEWTDIFDGILALHLSGNSLTQVPTHVIGRLFTQNLDQVKLGDNPWNCECKTVSPFHSLLMRYFRRFKDIDKIRCAVDGPYHPNQPIHKLVTSDFCVDGTYINPLDIVNVALIVIIVLILTKVVYDYIRLRQTGRIPVGPFTCIQYRGYQQA